MKNKNEIIEKANWCLNCKTKPCSTNGCPIHTNIPEFIEEIKSENFESAYKILMENNIFSHVCGLICPQEDQCEGSCIRGIKQTPTKIGELESFVNNWAKENDIKYNFEKCNDCNKKVAIIGSGPAGLECAFELLKNGYDVTIFEKDEKAGGILEYGIPNFRLPKKIVYDIITKIENMGAKFEFNKELGKDIQIEELQKKYDAIFLGLGAPKSSVYNLTEKENNKIYKSDVFLKAYNENKYIDNLGKVVVIGGGNVAMDAARAAVRMGAEKVSILYRRDKEHMPAREIELEEALEDGVEFKQLTRVISANCEDSNIVSLNCIQTEIVDGKAQDIENAEFIYDANSVVFAIGLKPDSKLLENQGIEVDDWGMVKIDENGMTNLKNVFAGGDLTESKSTVCRALSAGKKAAKGIISATYNMN